MEIFVRYDVVAGRNLASSAGPICRPLIKRLVLVQAECVHPPGLGLPQGRSRIVSELLGDKRLAALCIRCILEIFHQSDPCYNRSLHHSSSSPKLEFHSSAFIEISR